jgi:hypothetical protein
MPYHTLWRIDGWTPLTTLDQPKLSAGLQTHLRHADLHLVTAQIAHKQQHYVALAGCAGCMRGQCAPGCYATLLRRLLRGVCPDLRLHAVQRGLAPRPFAQLCYAVPTPEATPLEGALLTSWDEARLVLHWQHNSVTPGCAALLAVAGDQDAASVLRQQGWRVWWLPRSLLPLGRRLLNRSLPPDLPYARRTPWAPTLLFSHTSTTPTMQQPVEATP